MDAVVKIEDQKMECRGYWRQRMMISGEGGEGISSRWSPFAKMNVVIPLRSRCEVGTLQGQKHTFTKCRASCRWCGEFQLCEMKNWAFRFETVVMNVCAVQLCFEGKENAKRRLHIDPRKNQWSLRIVVAKTLNWGLLGVDALDKWCLEVVIVANIHKTLKVRRTWTIGSCISFPLPAQAGPSVIRPIKNKHWCKSGQPLTVSCSHIS